MKKILLSAAAFVVVAVSAVSIAPTTSEAIPAFARQTGAACLSCHFQSFPALAPFGVAFKMGGFTDVGEQALVEDDELSIPSSLNITMMMRFKYKSKKTTTKATGVTASKTTLKLPADQVLMVGGRIGSSLGAFGEVSTTGGGIGNWQLINSNDFGDFKGGIGLYNAGFGPTGAIEISSVFGQHSGKLNGGFVSAVENLITGGSLFGNTLSVAAWAGSDMGLVQLAAVAPGAAGNGTNTGNRLATLARVVFTPEFSGMNAMIGGGVISGTTGTTTLGYAKLSDFFIDAQVQGDVGDMSLGIYADYASKNEGNLAVAPAVSVKPGATTGFSIRAELEPVHNLLLGIGYGSANPVGTLANETRTQFSATYHFYQNVELNFHYNEIKNPIATTTASKITETYLGMEALM